MAETAQMNLPLLLPAQAQKHVTVNEAFARIDALASLTLQSRRVTVPPAASDGACFWVPAAAAGAWAGQAGKLAIGGNGGWSFATPRAGWRAWIVDEVAEAVFDGAEWRAGLMALSADGAALALRIVGGDHAIAAGEASVPALRIPAQSLVVAVSARVVTAITGSLTGWQFGSTGNADRFGSGLGLAAGSYTWGLLSSPTAYHAETDLVLTPAGGSFSGGAVRIAIHLFTITLPG